MIDPDLPAIAAVALSPLVGSFLGVVIDRLPHGRPIVIDRSRCSQCDHPLGARDLVPLLSWLASRGRCRYCKTEIGAFHPTIELGALAVAVHAVIALDGAPDWLLIASVLLGWTLLVLAWIDFRHLLLPDPLTLPLIPAGLSIAWVIEDGPPIDQAIGALTGYLGIHAVRWAYRRFRGQEGIGAGDAKLLAAAGAFVSWQGLPSVLFLAGTATLAVLGIASVLGRGVRPTAPVPFGIGIAFGLWIVWLYGPIVPSLAELSGP